MNDSCSDNGSPIQMFFGESLQAKKMLCYDWKATPLSTLDAWPFLLTSALHFCYSCPIPAFLLWGKEGILFYNDASQDLFKNSIYEASLNQTAATIWKTIWEELIDPIEEVFNTGLNSQSKTFYMSLSKDHPENETAIVFLFNALLNDKNKVEGISGYFIAQTETHKNALFDEISEIENAAENEALSMITKQQTLVQKRAEAENKNYLQDLFLAALSHELRSPLTSIISWVQILIQGDLAKERELMGLKAIEASAQAQNMIINDLIDISGVILGKMTVTLDEVNLIEILTQSINSILPLAENKDIKITTDIVFETIEVSADSIRLQQIFWNILSNAVKFTHHKGEINIGVELKKMNNEQKVKIHFKDNGIGINPDFLQHIFDLYNQADISFKKYDGLGIGLSMVANLLRLHKGSITASSEGAGKGATFEVILPVIR